MKAFKIDKDDIMDDEISKFISDLVDNMMNDIFTNTNSLSDYLDEFIRIIRKMSTSVFISDISDKNKVKILNYIEDMNNIAIKICNIMIKEDK